MDSKHTTELALDKCAVTLHPKIELKYKILQMTGFKLTPAKAFEKLCEKAVKGVVLTKSSLDSIQQEMKENYAKRMRNRAKIAEINRGISDGGNNRRCR